MLLSQVELRCFEIVKTIMTGELPAFWDVWPNFQSRLSSAPATADPGGRDSAAASAVVPHPTAWRNIFDERLKLLVKLSRDVGLEYPGISACMCMCMVSSVLVASVNVKSIHRKQALVL